MANTASANSLPPQAGVCLVQKYSVCCSAHLSMEYSLRVGYPWRPSLLHVQGKEVTLLGTIATGGRGRLANQGRAQELLPGDCSVSNETIALMNGHKAFRETSNCQTEVNAYTTVKANPLTIMEQKKNHLEPFYHVYIPRARKK